VGTFPKPAPGHPDTMSIRVWVRRTNWDAMKPRIQCVPTHWIPGFTASGKRPGV